MINERHPAEVLADAIYSGQTQRGNRTPAIAMLRTIPTLEAQRNKAEADAILLRAELAAMLGIIKQHAELARSVATDSPNPYHEGQAVALESAYAQMAKRIKS